VTELAPEWDVPALRLGALHLDEQRFDEAVVALERALALRPDNVDAALLLAVAYSRVELPEKSLAVLERVTAAVPDSVPALLALAERYDRLARSAELVAIAQRILALAPGHPVAEYRLAQQANLAGAEERALEHAQRAARGFAASARPYPATRPGDRWDVASAMAGPSLRLVAELQSHLGDSAAARASAIALIEQFPLYPDGHFLLGNMLLRARDAQGREHLERFKLLTDARVHSDLGTNFLRSNSLDEARREFAAARAIVPEDPVATVGLATVLRRSGDAAGALELLGQSRDLGADATTWYTNYILALGALQRREAALEAWDEARAMGLEISYEATRYVHADIDACR
jgi:tetratricopeptide (TPR) repeat protein